MKISILTPSYNYAQYIGDAIRSVRAQSGDIQHVIQDGASTDNTRDVVNALAHPALTFVSVSDAGQSHALNMALPRATGDLIGWLNADEFYLPGAFAALEAAVRKNPKSTLFIGDCIFVDKDGGVIRLLPAHRYHRFVLEHYGCFISSCATFMKRDALPEKPWDESLRRAMDWDLWLKLGMTGRVTYIPQILAAFRVHEDQVTNVPEHVDSEEFDRIRRKHSIVASPIKKFAATALHRAEKLALGSYERERQVRATFKGQSIAGWPDGELSASRALTLRSL